MSKSYDNGIFLSDSEAETIAKVQTMYTDPTKIRKNDPGHPETCPVFFFQRVFNTRESEGIAHRCRTGALGCVEDKQDMAKHLNAALAPIRERRRRYESSPGLIDEILQRGSERARPSRRRRWPKSRPRWGSVSSSAGTRRWLFPCAATLRAGSLPSSRTTDG